MKKNCIVITIILTMDFTNWVINILSRCGNNKENVKELKSLPTLRK